jgi:hypothetical protein
MSFLTEALTYLDMGWGVYPAHSISRNGFCSCGNTKCPCPGKHPIGRWLEYQNRLPTRREVELWFSSLECNIGTITGRTSNLAVIDVDGDLGISSLGTVHPENTLLARTGGGGFHLFYSLKEPVPTRTKAFPGIDIRADGGYVVLPPSKHKSGRNYEWVEVRRLAVFDPKPFERPLTYNGSGNGTNWADDLLQGVPEGSRSLTAAKLSGRYFRIGLSLEESWILIESWNERNDPPLPENELRRTFDAVYQKHLTTMQSSKEIVTMAQIRDLFINKENNA